MSSENGAGLCFSDTQDLRALMRDRFGLELRIGQESLARARVEKLLRATGAQTYAVFRERLSRDVTGELLARLADAITTNHTSFFREPAHFDFVRKLLRQQAGSRRPTRIWSAGCATGEEAYSLASSAVQELGWAEATKQVSILATDLSTAALRVAEEGTYPEGKFEGLSMEWRRTYLLRSPLQVYRFKPELRAMIRFGCFNLIGDKPISRKFDVIFCRNVMIYFDNQTRERVVQKLSEALEPGGYLITGHCEGLAGITHTLTRTGPAIHRKESREVVVES